MTGEGYHAAAIPSRRAPKTSSERIAAVLARIPRGRVVTYGQVAALAGVPRGARLVVYALKRSPPSVPWHRVVGQAGPRHAKISIKNPIGAHTQRRLLEKEGVRFDAAGRIDGERYGWVIREGRRRR